MKTDKERAEEILRDNFKDNFLDLDYLELYINAMLEFHNERLREELIAIISRKADDDFYIEIEDVPAYVDEYLKSKE